MQRYQREHFWNAIVWPILWPLLLMQAALILLCLVVGAMVWWMSPSYSSWSTTLWLTLALLVGSSLNVGAFLMLVKTRARLKEARFMQEITELERHSLALCDAAARSQPAHKCSLPDAGDESHQPLQRLASVNEVLGGLRRSVNCLRDASVSSKNNQHEHEQTLLDDLQHHQRQLKHLMAGRERAREESRLKSGYLTLLQRETDSLFEYLNAMAEKDTTDECQQNVLHVRERLADIRALLADFVQHSTRNSSGNDTGQESAHQLEENTTSQRHLRVLVVDDGPVNLMLARQMLETQGLQVEGVSSGEQALERQKSVTFDLVFMDIFMPNLDGFETTRRWRDHERAKGSSKSVLVALTAANADSDKRDDCLAAGMDDLLTKPYQPETLLNKIANWFPDAIKMAPPA